MKMIICGNDIPIIRRVEPYSILNAGLSRSSDWCVRHSSSTFYPDLNRFRLHLTGSYKAYSGHSIFPMKTLGMLFEWERVLL